MNTIGISLIGTNNHPKAIVFDIDQMIDALKEEFPDLKVDEKNIFSNGIDGLKEMLDDEPVTDVRKKVFSRIIKDRQKLLPAYSFTVDEGEEIYGYVNRSEIKFYRRSDAEISACWVERINTFLSGFKVIILHNGIQVDY